MRAAFAIAKSRVPPRFDGKRVMAGQAMVLGLVLILVLCVGAIVLFDSGQAVNKKVELTNAADAAAYSVAVQQARALNFAAYMNRGRVANEVAIAQAISLYSWMNQLYMTTITMRITMDALSAIPYVGPIFKAIGAAFKVAENILKGVRKEYNPAAQLIVTALDELNGIFATAATAVIEGVSRVDGMLVAKDVLQRNSANAKIGAVGLGVLGEQLLTSENRFLDTHRIPRTAGAGSAAQRAGADRFRNVVMQSRDGFSKDRGDSFGIGLIGFESTGGTDMVDYNRWAALDTMSLDVKIWPIVDIDLPLGWGGAQAVDRYKNQRFLNGFGNGQGWYSDWDKRRYRPYGDSLRKNGLVARMVERDANVMFDGGQHKKAFFTGYNGLRDYHDVKKNKAMRPYASSGSEIFDDNAGPVFTVYAETDMRNARTSSSIDGIGGPAGSPMATEDKAQNGKLSALSSAQVYFNRPPNYALFRRGDNKVESGNLFSPYWQARLVDTPNSIKVLVAGVGGI
ncbi:pilus assembly protein TadG-related protein [Xanthomonas campestris pv. phormiicola]|nr:pilus assembly protein TadG-related protein [Xanthomonas campestris pv. phormiicola]UYC16210.1 pilus assembly protein TadG-related protein [Xanthomonas campestris pv. phormiicola]